ncbi:MAG TPA: DUF4340 domain-containing protein [Gemmataceae bacterium]|nr:DUF4340 domain-containing protein [Gemmataceae bacterium]
MNFKTTYILFGVLAAVLVVFGVTQLLGLQSSKDKSVYALPSLHDKKKPIRSDDIGTVEITRQKPTEEKLVFYRTDQGWKLREPSVRVDKYTVDRLIQQIIDAKKEDKADISENLKQIGLDVPRTVVTLIPKGGDREWKLNLGDESVTGGSSDKVIYVTSSDRPNQPMAVRRMDIENVFKKLNDFRSKNLLAESSFDIVSAKLQEPKHELIDLEKTSDGKWRFDKPPFGEADLDGEPASPTEGTEKKITGVRDLLQAIVDLRVESDDDFGATQASDSDLAEKGLAKGQETLRIEVKRQPSSIGTEEKKPAVQDGLLIGKKVDDKGEKLWARLEDEKNLVKVPAKKVEAIRKVADNPQVLRNRDLTEIDTAKVDALDLRPNERDVVQLRKLGQPADWKLLESGKTQEADSSTVQGLLTALTAKRQVKDFPEASKTDAELGLDKPSAVVSVWVEGIKKEEKKEESTKEEKKDEKKDGQAKEEKKETPTEPALKDEKPTVKLVFGRKDKDLVYVRREAGNEVTRLAVPGSLLDKVTEGKVGYLSRKLANFAFNTEVSKIMLVHDGRTYELDKTTEEKAPPVWKLKQPADLAGRTADNAKVERLLSDLRDLQATKLIAEKASDSELDRYGLKTPVIQATVSVAKPDKKAEDYVYLFGKETEDKASVYAKQGNRDVVFLVSKSILEPLRSDWRDPTVFHLEVPKVKGLKLIGWQDVVGSPYVLDLERKSAQEWVVKNPQDFKLNIPFAENLLTELAQLKVVRFLGKGVPKPEQKLTLQDGALDIILTVEGEKEPLTLTIGGPSDNEGYFARSNKMVDEIFLVPKGNFEQIKKKPAYFKLP